ncbi:MAG: energy transducer TonB [Nitrospinae bacterium]|nr:energy transducer TonB [Nitrospinota bacterium]
MEPKHPFLTQNRPDLAEPAGPITTEATRARSDEHGRPDVVSPLSAPDRDGRQDSLQRTDFAHLIPPRVSHQVKPQYPLAARQRGVEGTVLLKAHITEGGMVQDIAVERSTGHPELDRSAMEALGRWRFEPARRGNTAMATWVLVPVTFELY